MMEMESEAETGLRRLRRLEQVLMNVESEGKAFFMGAWIISLAELEKCRIFYVIGGEHTCGTVCCAAGYAALDPELTAEGLYLAKELADKSEIRLRADSREEFAELAGECFVRFGGKSGYGALAEFFGIELEESFSIFDPDYYIWFSHTPLPVGKIGIQDVLEQVRHAIAMAEAPKGDGRGPPGGAAI
jgi:hypothetical protein